MNLLSIKAMGSPMKSPRRCIAKTVTAATSVPYCGCMTAPVKMM